MCEPVPGPWLWPWCDQRPADPDGGGWPGVNARAPFENTACGAVTCRFASVLQSGQETGSSAWANVRDTSNANSQAGHW